MADISKCTGEKGGNICPQRMKCYRHLASESPRQSYISPLFIDDACEFFWYTSGADRTQEVLVKLDALLKKHDEDHRPEKSARGILEELKKGL